MKPLTTEELRELAEIASDKMFPEGGIESWEIAQRLMVRGLVAIDAQYIATATEQGRATLRAYSKALEAMATS